VNELTKQDQGAGDLAKRASSKDAAGIWAAAAARIAQEDNARDIIVLDLRGISPITDYFVICTGSSDRQMRTVAEHIIEEGKSLDRRLWQSAGMQGGKWIVLDFVDVVVHIFDRPHRRYYDLELIWGAAPPLGWQRTRARAAKRSRPEDKQ